MTPAQLSLCNEAFLGEHNGILYSIRFHDQIQKANVNFQGDSPQNFAILGSVAKSPNRKLIRSMVHTLIEQFNGKADV